MRDLRNAARVRGCTPDVGRRQTRRRGDCLQHYAFERPLAQLADDQPQQKVLLFRRGLFK
jgi:hypothetical protein